MSGPDVSAYSPLIQPNVSTFVISGGRDPFMRNLNTIEKVELGGSCKLTPKKFKKMPFAVYDHMTFYVSDQFIFCGGHKRPGVVRWEQNIDLLCFENDPSVFTDVKLGHQ